MTTEISLTTKIGQDLINIKTTDFQPDQAVQFFSDLVFAYKEKIAQPAQPQQDQLAAATRSVENLLGGQVVPQQVPPAQFQAPPQQQYQPQVPQQASPPFDGGTPGKQCCGKPMIRKAGNRKSDNRPYVLFTCAVEGDNHKQWGKQGVDF